MPQRHSKGGCINMQCRNRFQVCRSAESKDRSCRKKIIDENLGKVRLSTKVMEGRT